MNIKKFNQFVNESSIDETPTMVKLIKTAEKDGYLTGMEASANYVTDAARKVADEWDKLNDDEKKVFRNTYYEKFLKNIHKI